MATSNTLTGVYFEKGAYIGAGGRLFIDLVDIVAALLGCVLISG